ncbi:hypothetical protein AJ80_02939 [Polytolypa hystricis UAMH7299]|uniref:FAD dependent oxidoreductase domain-containing protein n=1 Tax=Polytolypa hystricis (strain UAMH7299) TaxID=1447883 RepID=A0A2B7YG19_POLH7|nr:hypothetical protein AJ80_02939 [Polytolypa hystricis UAMH7299]
MPTTVILGGGIIGASIAYYLSDPSSASSSSPPHDIHIIDTSPRLLASASGFAAGFCAKDWFAPELSSLGELSFALHAKLAAEQGGRGKWGYRKSKALGLRVEYADGQRSGSGHDWLTRGASRAEVAGRKKEGEGEGDGSPAWLTRQRGGVVERISDDGSTAQVDPLRLSQWLLDRCTERDVRMHYPARAVSFTTDPSTGNTTAIQIQHLGTQTTTTLPCTHLVFAAGVWTPSVFTTLFPSSTAKIPILSLSGYSLLFRSPRHTLADEKQRYAGDTHAVFTTHPRSCGFSPEIFSRAGAEIYIAGLNSSEVPVPRIATEANTVFDPKQMEKVKHAAVTLMGKRLAEGRKDSVRGVDEQNDGTPPIDDLEILREGLCFRPWTESGLPIIGRIDERIQDLGGKGVPVGGVYMATGHGPWGISLALGTGKVVAETVRGEKTSADVSGLGFVERGGKARL